MPFIWEFLTKEAIGYSLTLTVKKTNKQEQKQTNKKTMQPIQLAKCIMQTS